MHKNKFELFGMDKNCNYNCDKSNNGGVGIQKLKLLYLNARSIIKKKRNVIVKIIEEAKANCIVISEHWLNNEEMQVFTIEGFKQGAFSARRDRVGGGVLILLKNDVILNVFLVLKTYRLILYVS